MCVEDGHLLAGRLIEGPSAAPTWRHLVLDIRVVETTAHHHFVIGSALQEPAKFGFIDAPPREIVTSDASCLDPSTRRDVIGRHIIAEDREDGSALDIFHRLLPDCRL